jgi:hypothetical protein
VTVKRVTAFVTNMDLKAGTGDPVTALPRELKDGKLFDLKPFVGTDRGAKVTVRVEGVPEPPPLPEWRE